MNTEIEELKEQLMEAHSALHDAWCYLKDRELRRNEKRIWARRWTKLDAVISIAASYKKKYG